MRYTMLFSLIASLIPLILCELAPKALASIIATDGEVINNSIPALRWTAAAFPFLFLSSAVGVLLQSTGKKIVAALLFAESFAFIPPFPRYRGSGKRCRRSRTHCCLEENR